MKDNERLQQRVQQAIQWEPLLRTSGIGVTAKDGVVMLSGTVGCPAKKAQPEQAAKKVSGVRAPAENIAVSDGKSGSSNDNEIAKQVINAFLWNTEIAAEKIHVKVGSGWVTLSGEVAWNQQKETAKKAIINLIGVRGVINNIAIRYNPDDTISIRDITAALLRSSSVNAEGVRLEVESHTAILLGSIDSWYEKEEATRIVWNAPGVVKVDNRLEVRFGREFD
jgi:osmotically-inducible protein OsmY